MFYPGCPSDKWQKDSRHAPESPNHPRAVCPQLSPVLTVGVLPAGDNGRGTCHEEKRGKEGEKMDTKLREKYSHPLG